MGKTSIGFVVASLLCFAQGDHLVTIVPNNSKPGRIAFREMPSNGKNEVRLVAPLFIGKDLDIRVPIAAGSEHDSLVLDGATEVTSTLDKVRLAFKPMVTAYDDGRSQDIPSEKRFLVPVRAQIGYYAHDDGDFSVGPVSLYGAGLMSHRADPMSTADDVELDINGLRFNNPLTGGNLMLVRKDLIRMNPSGPNLWQVEAGIETLEEQSATPSTPPPAGFVYRYARAGTNCTLDSAAVEICGGGGSVNPIPYIFSTTSQLRLEQQGGSIGHTELFLRSDVTDVGLRLHCHDIDVCEFTAEGSASDMTLRMEGRSGVKYIPAAFGSVPEWQIGKRSNYPFDFTLAVNENAMAVLQGKPMVFVASDGTFTGLQAQPGSLGGVWSLPNDLATTGDCLKVLNAATRIYEHGPCGGGGSFVDLTNNQTISGIKFFATQARSELFAVASSVTSPFYLTAYEAGGGGVMDIHGSGGAVTVKMEGVLTSTNVGRLVFLDPITGSDSLLVRGGSSTINSTVQINRGGVIQSRMSTSSAFGGTVEVYTTSGVASVRIDGNGVGRILVPDPTGTLLTGLTTTVVVGGCTMVYNLGVLTSATGTC